MSQRPLEHALLPDWRAPGLVRRGGRLRSRLRERRRGNTYSSDQLATRRRTRNMESCRVAILLSIMIFGVAVIAPPPPPRIRSQLNKVLELTGDGIAELRARGPSREFIQRVPGDFKLIGSTNSCPWYMIPPRLKAELFTPFSVEPFGVRSLLRRGNHCYLWYLPGEFSNMSYVSLSINDVLTLFFGSIQHLLSGGTALLRAPWTGIATITCFLARPWID